MHAGPAESLKGKSRRRPSTRRVIETSLAPPLLSYSRRSRAAPIGLAAEAALDLGYALHVPMPFTSKTMKRTQRTGESKETLCAGSLHNRGLSVRLCSARGWRPPCPVGSHHRRSRIAH